MRSMDWSISVCSAVLMAASLILLWSASNWASLTPMRAASAVRAAARSPPLASISATSSVLMALTTPLAPAGARNTSGWVTALSVLVTGSKRLLDVPISATTAPWPVRVKAPLASVVVAASPVSQRPLLLVSMQTLALR
jgi:hypothetical protein